MSVLDTIWHGISNALLMAWAVWWALVLATGLGAASSSCSYAAIAIAKSLFQKGASAACALAFQFASTNLVVELGVVIWVLIGWQFTLAEFVGGLVLIGAMTLLLRLFVSERLEVQARSHAQQADGGHQHRSAGEALSIRQRLRSISAWSDVAHNFRNDWKMLYKEILAGFLLAGFIGLLPNSFLGGLFLEHAPALPRLLENVVVGPIIAVLSFVCSVGNVPLAAVLWSGGIGFAGVIAFIFADLIVLPIMAIYRKYYGTPFALRIVALMLVTIVIAALAIDGLFSLAGLIPYTRPTRTDIFGSVTLNYKLFTNAIGLAVFVALFVLTMRHGVSDPVCGMQVDRAKAVRLEQAGQTHYFCSEHCAAAYTSHTKHPPA
jgi:hypothetical protein